MEHKLQRREFLKLSSLAVVGIAAAPPVLRRPLPALVQGTGARFGRVAIDYGFVRARPGQDGRIVGKVLRDDVVPIVREVVGKGLHPSNHIWFELPDGYIYSTAMQVVRNEPNESLRSLPADGLFGEVSVPFADARSEPNPSAVTPYRVYYSAVFQVYGVQQAPDGSYWLRVKDDADVKFWLPAHILRPLTQADIAPISPHADGKLIVVNLARQSMSAFEGANEVFRTLVSTGKHYVKDGQWVDAQSTPVITAPLWSKRITRHMQGGSATAGWDIPGVPFVSFFSSNGAAVHGAFWHNHFGQPRSAGCINCTPEAARWIFRWTLPKVDYLPGFANSPWPGGTRVQIEHGTL